MVNLAGVANTGGPSEQSAKVFSVKIISSANLRSFLPHKFTAIRYPRHHCSKSHL